MVFNMNGTIRYTIRPYDTLWMLAQVFNTSADSIMELNPGIDPWNLQIGQVVTINPGLQQYPSHEEDGSGEVADNEEEISGMLADLMNYMHILWEQHVFWTRMAVMGLVHNLPETDFILQRLLRNPADFANVLEHFYGEESAQTFAQLFTDHLTIAAQLVKDAMSGDTQAFAATEKSWYDNADQIAEFLSSINPNWNEDDWSAMLQEHLDLLKQNISDMISGNYEASINGFDDIEQQALEMADDMAEGITMQFPG